MTKRLICLGFMLILCEFSTNAVFAEMIGKAAHAQASVPAKQRPAHAILSGTIINIDKTDPTNIKIGIKDSKDNSIKTVNVMPWTDIKKATDISELKMNEPIRVISRKINDKETAMGIVFGNLKSGAGPGPAPTKPRLPGQGKTKK